MLQVKKLNFYWESGTTGKLILLKEKDRTNEQRKIFMGDKIREER